MEEAGQEAAARRAFRICRMCADPLQSPAAVEPCGHVFCHGCIQPRAGPDAAASCPLCREPIGAIRLLPQGQDNRAGRAPRRSRRRLHPFVLRWRQRQQQEQQEQAAAGGGRRRRLADGDRAPSPVPRQRARRELQEMDRNGQQEGTRPLRDSEALGGGDNGRRPAVVPPDGQRPWPV